MAFTLVSDELWEQIRPMLPRPRFCPEGGRPRLSDRACLTGIVFVLRTGTPWRFIPRELGCGSGVTCWRRLRDWTKAGVWKRVHAKLLRAMEAQGLVDPRFGMVDSQSARAILGGRTPDPTPRIAGKKAANVTC
jgi:transposase